MEKLTYLFTALVFLIACNGNADQKETQQSNVKYEIYQNERYEYSVEYPEFLIPQGEATNQDGQKFLSENQEIQLLVYYEYKSDYMTGGELYSIDEAYKEDLKSKDGIFNTKLEDQHYIIEYEKDNLLQTDYATKNGDSYFNICFQYPEKEKEMMKAVIEYVINSFSVKLSENEVGESENNASAGCIDDMFPAFIEGFLKNCYWGKNFNTLLRNKDKTLATYIDSKMDVRRYYAPGTITRLGTRDEDFGFSQEDDFMTKSRATGDLILEYVNDNGSPCELIYSNANVIYYERINTAPDVLVNNETFETKPVKIAYPEAQIMAIYLPNTHNNPRGFYFIHTPDGWKLAFVDDTLCGN